MEDEPLFVPEEPNEGGGNERQDSPDAYKRSGFYSAVNSCGDLQELAGLLEKNDGLTDTHIDDIVLRFSERIDSVGRQIQDLQAQLAAETGDPGTPKRLEDIRLEMAEVYEELGREKRRMVDNCLDDSIEEIKKLLVAQGKLYDDWRALNAKAFRDNQPALEVTKKRAEQLRDQISRRYAELEKQLALLDKGGANTPVFRLLLGQGMALAAGWFFSVYLMQISFSPPPGFGQQDVWFFLLNSILSALSANPLLALLQVIVSLALVSLAAYYAHRFLRKGEQERNKEEILIQLMRDEDEQSEEQGGNMRGKFSLNVRSGSFFEFWLQVAPLLLGLGILFVVLKMGGAAQYVSYLDISVAGQFIGTMVALAAGSIVYVFLAKIADVSRLRWINYVVLALVFGIPLLLLVENRNVPIALIGFVYAVALAAFPLAFGMRYQGLTQTAHEMNQILAVCSDFIRQYSAPQPASLQSNRFRLTMKHLMWNLLERIKRRDANAAHRTQEEAARTRRNFLLRVLNWFRQLFRNARPDGGQASFERINKTFDPNQKSAEQAETVFLVLDDFEKQNFPDIDKRLTALQYLYQEIKAEYLGAKGRIFILQREIDHKVRELFELRRNESAATQKAVLLGTWREVWLREGFDLGIWHLKNKILPDRDCPPPPPPAPLPPGPSGTESPAD